MHVELRRAEATDVANAVLDGVDAMLLGAETLRGGYPVQTLQTVLSICRQAEATFDYTNHFDFLMSEMLMADMDADIESETPMAGVWTLPPPPSPQSHSYPPSSPVLSSLLSMPLVSYELLALPARNRISEWYTRGADCTPMLAHG